jgi:hypothetical protein
MQKKIAPIALIVIGLGLLLYKPLFSMLSPAKLELKIQPAPALLPAIYKVYANENALDGKYSLFKMLVTNTSSNTATDVEVAYQIPNLLEWKTITRFAKILPGQSVAVNCYPVLPEKLIERTTSSKEQVNIKVTGKNLSTIEENFGIDVKGRNDFMYTFLPKDEIRTPGEYFDNMPLLSCLVTPQDPIIKYYTQQVQEKVLKGETASVTNKEEEGVRFMLGLYNATLMSHMVYSGTTGVPAKIDDVNSIVQSIRLPREVVTGKTGLCIELSLLYASVMSCAGMEPIVYLIPGHAYPGFRMNGHYYAIESTGIGGEGMGGSSSADQAFKTGMKQLNEFFQKASMGDDRYMIVDIRESIKNGAEAMELKDDTYLRQRVDEIAKTFEPRNTNAGNGGNADNNPPSGGNGGGGGGNTGGGGTAGYNLYEGVATFSYPGSWKLMGRQSYSMPQLKHMVVNRDNTCHGEVYSFAGFTNPEQAIYAIQQFVYSKGGGLQYQQAGQTNSGYTVFSGQTFYNGGGLNWVAAFRQNGNGVSGIAVGADVNTGAKYQNVIMNIINSLR